MPVAVVLTRSLNEERPWAVSWMWLSLALRAGALCATAPERAISPSASSESVGESRVACTAEHISFAELSDETWGVTLGTVRPVALLAGRGALDVHVREGLCFRATWRLPPSRKPE